MHSLPFDIRINLISNLVAFYSIYFFGISYQRCGRRTASISSNPFIPYVGHVKTHIISKNWLVNFGNIFFIWVYVLFWGKIPVFLKTGTRYRFGSWKFGCAVKSYIYIMKITLIVLKEDFAFFFWSGTYLWFLRQIKFLNKSLIKKGYNKLLIQGHCSNHNGFHWDHPPAWEKIVIFTW